MPFEFDRADAASECWTRDSRERHRRAARPGRRDASCSTCGSGRARRSTSLIAGKTGSGKSTLLHALITNLALWYSPDEVELYLIDFKKGVEFKTYADARAAARPRRSRSRASASSA